MRKIVLIVCGLLFVFAAHAGKDGGNGSGGNGGGGSKAPNVDSTAYFKK